MATTQSNTQNGTDDALPGRWSRVDDEQLNHREREAYEHEDGLRVTVEHQQRPDQMHDPRTARMDSGFIARVRDDVGADLTHELAAKTVARDAAREFVDTYPDGEFDVPTVDEQPYGAPVDWRCE